MILRAWPILHTMMHLAPLKYILLRDSYIFVCEITEIQYIIFYVFELQIQVYKKKHNYDLFYHSRRAKIDIASKFKDFRKHLKDKFPFIKQTIKC
jgi:hypothetical protein